MQLLLSFSAPWDPTSSNHAQSLEEAFGMEGTLICSRIKHRPGLAQFKHKTLQEEQRGFGAFGLPPRMCWNPSPQPCPEQAPPDRRKAGSSHYRL